VVNKGAQSHLEYLDEGVGEQFKNACRAVVESLLGKKLE
jgi:hypothetical protein